MFRLTTPEKAEVVANCDVLPYAFTEHGAIQAANVLASPRRSRWASSSCAPSCACANSPPCMPTWAKRLDELEGKTEGLALSHDTFSRNTRLQLRQLFDALRELMTPPDPPKRPIGFVTHEDKAKT